MHSRLHQPGDSESPLPVAEGLAALLHALSDTDKRALARLLLAGGPDGPRGESSGPTTLSAGGM